MPGPAHEHIPTVVIDEHVISWTAEAPVVSRAADDHVGAAEPPQDVVPAQATDLLGGRSPDHRIGAAVPRMSGDHESVNGPSRPP